MVADFSELTNILSVLGIILVIGAVDALIEEIKRLRK